MQKIRKAGRAGGNNEGGSEGVMKEEVRMRMRMRIRGEREREMGCQKWRWEEKGGSSAANLEGAAEEEEGAREADGVAWQRVGQGLGYIYIFVSPQQPAPYGRPPALHCRCYRGGGGG